MSEQETILQERCMLARLKVRMWTASKAERPLSVDVEDKHGARRGTVSTYKKLMRSDSLAAFDRARSGGKATFNHMTLPWMDGGVRILPSDLYWEFMEKMAVHRQEADAAVDDIIKNFPSDLEYERKRLGRLFRETDYPSIDSLVSRFSFDVSIWPLADPRDDWRVNLPEDVKAELKADLEKRIWDSYQKSMGDLWNRVYEMVNGIYDRISDPKRIFRNNLLEDAMELLELLPKLNITDDPKLRDMGEKIKQNVLKFPAETLRLDQGARSEASSSARRIIGELDTIMASLPSRD